MKTLVPKIMMIAAILGANLAAAKKSPTEARVLGNWELEEFVILSQGEESDYCAGAAGSILYERSGHMSVSINCDPSEGKHLFYAANFEIKGDTIFHQVTQASDLKLVGRRLPRKVEKLTETSLVLTGPFGTQGDTLRIVWKRDSAPTPVATSESLAYLTHLKLKPGTQEKFLQEVKKIVEFSRSEPGNIAWYVQQSVEDPTEIVFYTRWVNQAAIEWHLSAPPLKNYIERSAELLAQPAKLVKYRPLDLAD